MVAILGFDRDQIINAVRHMYTSVARTPTGAFHFPVGRDACHSADYPQELLQGIPDGAIESFAGVGNPFHAGVIRKGDRVLDIGAGSGTDTLIAARLVGPGGRVHALDITPAMQDKLRASAKAGGFTNVRTLAGSAEQIPLPDAAVDVVTSNGVLNLVPDKRKAAAEIFRVLRPGGRVQLADIVIERPVAAVSRDDPQLWAECVVGATVKEDYLELFRDAGLGNITVLRTYDYFAGSPSAETRTIASAFGAQAIELSMTRPAAPESALQRIVRRLNPVPLVRRLRQRGLLGVAMIGASALACYGTLGALTVLALFGIAPPVNEAGWAMIIAALAAFAPVGIAMNRRWHGASSPLAVALAGVAMILWALFVAYDWRLEALGFLMLAAAAGWDVLLFRRTANCCT